MTTETPEQAQPRRSIYKRIVPLDKNEHRGLWVDGAAGFDFARETNAVVLTTAEFRRAAIELPIVFRVQEENGPPLPIAVLSVERGQNLFIRNDGTWEGDYIPAYLRRYPFTLGGVTGTEAQLTVCIDDTYPGINTEGRGQRLFLEDGEQSPYLANSVKFLQDYQQEYVRTQAFCNELNRMNLFESMRLDIRLPDQEPRALTGFLGVSRKRLAELKGAELERLFTSGALELIYSHLLSLNTIERMVRKSLTREKPVQH